MKKKGFNAKEELLDYEEDYSQTVFYHGTSDIIATSNILPPSITGNLREDFRQLLLDKVFFTDSLLSAIGYAKKASKQLGGNPIVYCVEPIGEVWHINDTEYIADSALILSTISIR